MATTSKEGSRLANYPSVKDRGVTKYNNTRHKHILNSNYGDQKKNKEPNNCYKEINGNDDDTCGKDLDLKIIIREIHIL